MISSFRKNWFKMGKAESPSSQRILNLENQSGSLSIKQLVFYISVYNPLNICTYPLCIPLLLSFFRFHCTYNTFLDCSRSCAGDLMSTRSCSEPEHRTLRDTKKVGRGWWWWWCGKGLKGKLKGMNEHSGLLWQLPKLSQREGVLNRMRGENRETGLKGGGRDRSM